MAGFSFQLMLYSFLTFISVYITHSTSNRKKEVKERVKEYNNKLIS